MDENHYSYQQLFGSLPPEYRMWYTTQLLMYNGQNAEPTSENLNSADAEWSMPNPGMSSSPEINVESFLPPSHESITPMTSDSGQSPNEPESGENANINQWNYLYYLQMLSEMEQERSFTQVDLVSAENVEKELQDDSESPRLNSSFSNELYSSKVKKGLKSPENVFELNQTSQSPVKVDIPNEASNKTEKDSKNKNSSGLSSKKNPKRSSLARESLSFDDEEESLINLSRSDFKSEKVFCKTCKSCSSPILNNSFSKMPCLSGNKCLLNVNNNLQKKVKHEIDVNTKQEVKEALKQEEPFSLPEKPSSNNISAAKSRKLKIRSTQTNECVDELQASNPDAECKISKKKNISSKSRFRLERGKLPRHNQRKRHVDVERESSMDNLKAILHVVTGTLRHLPSQPWFKYTVESLTSLAGVIIGSLCILAFIVWEGLKSSYGLLSVWFFRALQWVRINGSSFVQMVFVFIPGLTGTQTKATSSPKDSTKGEPLPTNGDDAVRRLLHLKGQDPYSILGITPAANDEEIKRRYKSQAVLVHPDKNPYSGAEEAFKVLASAFDILGNTEKRTEYDRDHNLKAEGDEITTFLEKIQRNIEEMQSILGCQSCGKNHKRYKTDRQADSARYCSSCKTFHAAREGDLWAETTMMGFKWHYYAYLDKAIFDITEWVTCQVDLMTTVEANSHSVTCRLATPKGKNRNGAYSRMQDLQDLVNDLLQKSRQGGPGAQNGQEPTSSEKTKSDRGNLDGSRGKGRRNTGVNASGRKRK